MFGEYVYVNVYEYESGEAVESALSFLQEVDPVGRDHAEGLAQAGSPDGVGLLP